MAGKNKLLIIGAMMVIATVGQSKIKEIKNLLNNKLIRESKSPWSCAAFYVYKASEIERGSPRLVINYKPLNKVLKWIRYPIPNKIIY